MTDSLHRINRETVDTVLYTGARDLGHFTKDYGLAVGYASPDDEKDRILRYLIINRVTGVVEGFGTVLALAISSLHNAQEILNAVREVQSKPDTKSPHGGGVLQ